MPSLRLTHAQMSSVPWEHYETQDEAIRHWIHEQLESAGFNMSEPVEILGNLKWSEYVEFRQTNVKKFP